MALAELSPTTVAIRGSQLFGGSDAAGSVVSLWGEHDVSSVAALSETLARAMALNEGDLVVDLSAVEFMDAATVGVIIRARNLLRARSRSLVVRSPSKSARRLLEVCGLSVVIERDQWLATAG